MSASADVALRKRILVSIGLFGSVICGGIGIGGWFAFERWYDFRPAAAELPQAERAYRASGMPWEARDLAPSPPVRPEENGGPALREASELAYKGKWSNLSPKLQAAADAGRWSEVAAGLATVEPTLARFERALSQPRFDFGRDLDMGPALLFPEFAGMKSGTKMLGLRARLRAARGDAAGAVADVRLAARLARVSEETDANLIALLVRVACEAIAYDDIRRIAGANPETASALLAELERPWSPPSFERALRGEAYMSVATIRNLRDLPRFVGNPDALARAMTETDRRRLLRTGVPQDQKQRAFLARSLQAWTVVAGEMRQHPNDPLALGAAMDRIASTEEAKRGLSHILNSILLPVFSHAGITVPKIAADREITRAYLRALAHRRRTGAWPKAILAGKDPFGRTYISRREGAGFRIYSLGADGKDNGGLTSGERKAGSSRGDDVAAVFPPKARRSP